VNEPEPHKASWVPETEPLPDPVVITSTFGPSAIATYANAVTVTRLLVSPLLFALISREGASWTTFLLWIGLAATDGVDGWIARRHGTTRSGAFLDPLADKVLVFGAMAMLVAIDRFWWLPVALVGVRELAVSLLRVQYGRRGLAIPATKGAKLKTLVQALAVGAALWPGVAEDASWLATSLLTLAVLLTLATGWQYFQAGLRLTTTEGSREIDRA
jgi:CDP-diacylglycerol--glycerol-3-phosphate 3-phosphatidyltransferase